MTPDAGPGAPIQRAITQGEGKGEYYDDTTSIDYAFLAQNRDATVLLFANRDEIGKLRDEIVDGLELGSFLADETIRGWIKSVYDEKVDTSSKAYKLLEKLPLVEIENDQETQIKPRDWNDVQYLTAALIGKEWGRLAYKKPGFGERAPKAKGTVYINQGQPVAKDALADFLDFPAKDLESQPSAGRFAGVTLTPIASHIFALQWLGNANQAEFVPGFESSFFYLSSATRKDDTEERGEGNYVIAGTNYGNLDAIEVDKEEIKEEYDKLVVDRSTRNWKTVGRTGSRGGTQAQAMGGWNALGMAAYAKKVLNRNDLDISQDYEWLHIQGVQNGGKNKKENLGAGTWIANSRMIPFENQIRAWGNRRDGSIEARYETTTNPDKSPILDKITIKVAASKDHQIGPIERYDPLTVEFDAQKGQLRDSFSNKVAMKGFRQRQTEKQSGVLAGSVMTAAFSPDTMDAEETAADWQALDKVDRGRANEILAFVAPEALTKLRPYVGGDKRLLAAVQELIRSGQAWQARELAHQATGGLAWMIGQLTNNEVLGLVGGGLQDDYERVFRVLGDLRYLALRSSFPKMVVSSYEATTPTPNKKRPLDKPESNQPKKLFILESTTN